MGEYIKSLNEISKENHALVGGKGANLGELVKGGFLVPSGFCITTEAFDLFIKENNIDINNVAEDPDVFRKRKMPIQLTREIITAFDHMFDKNKR